MGSKYGWAHQQQRKRWAGQVATGTVACVRCGRLILPGMAWDLGHDDYNPGPNNWAGPEHSHCNRAAGARKSSGSFKVRKAKTRNITSRRW